MEICKLRKSIKTYVEEIKISDKAPERNTRYKHFLILNKPLFYKLSLIVSSLPNWSILNYINKRLFKKINQKITKEKRKRKKRFIFFHVFLSNIP